MSGVNGVSKQPPGPIRSLLMGRNPSGGMRGLGMVRPDSSLCPNGCGNWRRWERAAAGTGGGGSGGNGRRWERAAAGSGGGWNGRRLERAAAGTGGGGNDINRYLT